MPQARVCSSQSRVTAALLCSFIAAGVSAELPVLPPAPARAVVQPSTSVFALRHVLHRGTYQYPNLYRRLDVPEQAPLAVTDENGRFREPLPPLWARSWPLTIQRLANRSTANIDDILDYGHIHGTPVALPASAWSVDEVLGPNVSDKETVLSFARMASNAYILEPHTGDWEDVGGGLNYTEDFGWESDGLRGHIFADANNSTIVIGLKGTSPAVFDGSETTTNDKLNDNLFFSCCCGQGGQYLWRRVCDCQTSAYTCNSTCLVQALRDKNRYYHAARDLYANVTALYPGADIWVTGHSLGGAVSSFLGLTYGLPVVTFEAVPEAMPAARLGLPTPPGYQIGTLQKRPMTGGFHFGHTADPVYMGECNKASSSCTFGGYAMQSVCHTGFKCVYNTVDDFGWRVGIGTHKIVSVIRDVLEKYEEPAACQQYVNCTDCYPWDFFESNGTEPSTTSSMTSPSTSSRTRTETCKTPGWWGCLDQTTTKGETFTSSDPTSSTLTSTCKTPGWFGCKDATSTTTKSSASTTTRLTPVPIVISSPPPISTICAHRGWLGGCDGSIAIATNIAQPATVTSLSSSVLTCAPVGWFEWARCDTDQSATPSSTTATERFEI